MLYKGNQHSFARKSTVNTEYTDDDDANDDNICPNYLLDHESEK